MKLTRLFSLLLSLLLLLCTVTAFAADQITVVAADYPVEESGSYSTMEEVAVYLATYGKLPGNYITKSQAENLGWDNRKGNLWEVAPGCSIGGNRFGNYENLLPNGSYTECDINFDGGYRNAERIIFSKKGDLYYTNDHYTTFTPIVVDFSAPASGSAASVSSASISEDDEPVDRDGVALYLHTYGHLPNNYLTKEEAKEFGWSSKKDNLGEVMPGCAIGGDSFGNKEGLLPSAKGRKWYECDVNVVDGKRSNERLCYSNDGLIYYTPDNHKSFTQLY